MNSKCSSARLLKKSPVSNSFALKSFKSLSTAKGQRPHRWKISLNPTRGKGPPGAARSPGKETYFFTINLSSKSFYINENQFNRTNKKQQSITI